MRPTQIVQFYVKVWDRFPDAPGVKPHPHFLEHRGYPVFKIITARTGDELLLVPDDRFHLVRILADHCTLANECPMWQKDKPPN